MFLIASPRPARARLFALLRHLGASRSHLDCDRGRVDEASLYLQSGHGAALPAPAYIWIAFPARFLDMFEAFGL